MRIVKCMLMFVMLLVMSCSNEHPETTVTNPYDGMDEKVKSEFLQAWNAYVKYAEGHDALRPLTKNPRDWYDTSLVMTPLDAFDTMVIMGLDTEAEHAKQLVLDNLNFDIDMEIQVFEISIRLLGGLLSSYQLDGDERFLDLAHDLTKRLMPAFDSPTGMPYRMVNLKTGKTNGAVSNPAEIGTYLLEFGTISKLTGDPSFYDAAKKAMTVMHDRRSELGLVGTTINVETGEWIDRNCHISGMIDSYYEYLLKAWLLFGDTDMKNMWDESIEPINTYLADETDSGLWYGRANMDTGERTGTLFGALDAFFPAVLALAGDMDRAKRLEESCYTMWNLHGIEPEMLDYSTMTATAEFYMLRPEIIESAYYLYHYTGDDRYREMGKTFYDSLVKYCRVDEGYAQLKSVVTMEKEDGMESFFLAETLKYLYLLYAPKEALDFENIVFNTEAHPLRNTWDQ